MTHTVVLSLLLLCGVIPHLQETGALHRIVTAHTIVFIPRNNLKTMRLRVSTYFAPLISR